MLHECSPANARRVANKIRAAVTENPVEANGESIAIDASIGLAVIDRDNESAASVLATAHAACYDEKLRHQAALENASERR